MECRGYMGSGSLTDCISQVEKGVADKPTFRQKASRTSLYEILVKYRVSR